MLHVAVPRDPQGRPHSFVADDMRRRLRGEVELMRRITLRAALLAVCAEFDVHVDWVTGVCRKTYLVRARAAFAILASARFQASTTRIGQAAGARDHTTALNWLRIAHDRSRRDEDFRARLARAEAALWPPMEPVCLERSAG